MSCGWRHTTVAKPLRFRTLAEEMPAAELTAEPLAVVRMYDEFAKQAETPET
jgi:hypothetical protein